ncbi:MAG: hypothetical protein B6I28_01470 [Fusobacteriia bacterium 4572_132]|nr:MAG: hypothetical protein B6I28_01470 [Fusobacteriia bacterium 4572_132]
MKKKIIGLVGLLMVIGLIGTLIFIGIRKKNQKEKIKKVEKAKAVKTSQVIKKSIKEKVEVGAEIQPFKEVVHITETGGDVEKIYVINGRWVKEGEKIVKLENKQIESIYMQAKASYINAKSNYERAKKFSKDQTENQLSQAKMAKTMIKMQLKKAVDGAKTEEIAQVEYSVESAKKNYEVMTKNYEKNKRLYEKKLISESSFLEIENAYKNAETTYKTAQKSLELIKLGADDEDITILKSQLENAEDNYNLAKKMVDEEAWKYDIQGAESGYLQAKANYELAKKNYDELTLIAKISGIVINLDLKEKNKVNPGTEIFTIVNNDDMIMTVGISEKNIEGIQKFNNAKVFIEAVSETYEGVVYEINPAADKETKKFDIKLKINNKGHKIKKGMYAKAIIDSGEHEGILVSKKAIVVEGIRNNIFIVENGVAKKVEIKLGSEMEDLTEIITNKVKSGNKVAVEGQFLLEDKDRVSEVK